MEVSAIRKSQVEELICLGISHNDPLMALRECVLPLAVANLLSPGFLAGASSSESELGAIAHSLQQIVQTLPPAHQQALGDVIDAKHASSLGSADASLRYQKAVRFRAGVQLLLSKHATAKPLDLRV